MLTDEEFGLFISLREFCRCPALRQAARLPSWQEIHADHPHIAYRGDPDSARRLFVTHRWDAPDHPDPTRWQLNALRRVGAHYEFDAENVCFWYDYMSLPQRQRTPEQNRLFQAGLKNIRRLVGQCENITLIGKTGKTHIRDVEAMKKRGWIVFELFVARSNWKKILPLYEREANPVVYGRNLDRWDAVTIDIRTQAPLDSREQIHDWFLKKGISCTNGNDLAYLAALLHEELTQYDYSIPPPGIEYGRQLHIAERELIKYGVHVSTHLSSRFPNIYVTYKQRLPRPFAEEPVWVVSFAHRPRLPEMKQWFKLADGELHARLIDPTTMTSPMYPGIVFELSQDGSQLKARLA